MSKLGPISIFFSPVPCDSLVLQVSGVKGEQVCKIWCYCSHSLILVTGSSTWHLMAKNSEDLKKKELLLYKKMAWAIRRLPRPWNWAAARWPRPYSGLTGQVPLRTGLAMVDQRSWVHVLSVISRGCVWERSAKTSVSCLQSSMVWGCLSAAGTGELKSIKGTMNANMYCDILKQSMIPSLRRLGRRAVFQHNNDYCLAK